MSVGSAVIQKHYNDLYREARNYIWPFSAVERLVDLEMAAYHAIPDVEKVARALSAFKSAAFEIYIEDEDFKKALDAFYDIVRDEKSSYCKITQVQELSR